MVRLTTVALLERKPTISRSLFSRYWRDVHGIMAARIPGFESYAQYHVTPLDDVGCAAPERFEGIALVTFADAADRAGLADSDISQYIQRDEQNVFHRVLLYNLVAGASTTRRAGGAPRTHAPSWLPDSPPRAASLAGSSAFVILPAGAATAADPVLSALESDSLLEMHVHQLDSGDPTVWNNTDMAGRRFSMVVHGRWSDIDSARAAIERATQAGGGNVGSYWVNDVFVMVDRGRPTALGLRGWNALQTIYEAGAANQLEDTVMDAVYGRLPRS